MVTLEEGYSREVWHTRLSNLDMHIVTIYRSILWLHFRIARIS